MNLGRDWAKNAATQASSRVASRGRAFCIVNAQPYLKVLFEAISLQSPHWRRVHIVSVDQTFLLVIKTRFARARARARQPKSPYTQGFQRTG